jgi:hypothetical protein
MIRLFIVAALSLCACREATPHARERRGPLVTADQPPLKEDPAAGKRSELQWKKHLQAEEVERKMFFDKNHAPEHRALITRIKEARERLDKPKTPGDLQNALAALQAPLQELQSGIDALDRWKTSSQLIPDYEALIGALREGYPAARLAAMSGNTESLSAARTSFDGHLRSMHTWLTRVESDEDEAFEEGEL